MHRTANTPQQQALARASRTSQARTPAKLPWDKDPARCQRFGHLLVPGLAAGEQFCTRCHARLLCPICVPDRPGNVILSRCEQHRDQPIPPPPALSARLSQKGGSSHGQM